MSEMCPVFLRHAIHLTNGMARIPSLAKRIRPVTIAAWKNGFKTPTSR